MDTAVAEQVETPQGEAPAAETPEFETSILEDDAPSDAIKHEAPVTESAPDEAASAQSAPPDRLAALEDGMRELRMRNAYLEGLSRRNQQQEQQPEEQFQDQGDLTPDYQQLNEEFRTNPAAAFDRMLDAKLNSHLGRMTQQQTQQQRMQESTNADIRLLNERYPEIHENETFRTLASQMYDELKATAGGEKPGLRTAAAAMAYGELVKAGHIDPRVYARPPQGSRPQAVPPPLAPNVREMVRNAPRAGVVGGAVQQGAKVLANPLAGWSNEDQAAIRAVCKDMGVSEKEWLVNYREAKKQGVIS